MVFVPDPEDNRDDPKAWYSERDKAKLYTVSYWTFKLQDWANDIAFETSWLKSNTKDPAVAKAATEVNRTMNDIIKKMIYQRNMIEGMIEKIKAAL